MNDELQIKNGEKESASSSPIRHSSFAFLNSIRWRLQIWYGVILVVVLTGFGATAFQLMRGSVYRRVDDELQRRAGELSQLFRQPPRNRGPEGRPGERPFDGPPDGRGPLDDFRAESPGQREFHLPPR